MKREHWQYAGRTTHCGIDYHQWICTTATAHGRYVIPVDWYRLTALGAGSTA